MKRFLIYAIAVILIPSLFVTACNEAKTTVHTCDTLTVNSGKAKQISVSSTDGRFHAKFISIESLDGKVYALKSKSGWQIVDAEKALDVLIADLELCRQQKP